MPFCFNGYAPITSPSNTRFYYSRFKKGCQMNTRDQRSDWQGTHEANICRQSSHTYFRRRPFDIKESGFMNNCRRVASFSEHQVHPGRCDMAGIFLTLIHFNSAFRGCSLTAPGPSNTCGPLPLGGDRRWLPGPAERGMPSWVLEFPKHRACRRAGPISLDVRAVA